MNEKPHPIGVFRCSLIIETKYIFKRFLEIYFDYVVVETNISLSLASFKIFSNVDCMVIQ